MRLAEFILANIEPILTEWDLFARDIWPGTAAADPATLRDDAEEMLRAAVSDMKSKQTAAQQADKSKGKGGDGSGSELVDRASAAHGAGRVASGFDLAALIAEYRALRASVIRLWRESRAAPELDDLDDLTRFNESIDQSLTEAVVAHADLVERERRAAREVEERRGRELRDINQALLTSSVKQHELTEQAEKAEALLRESEYKLTLELDAAQRLAEVSGQIIDPEDGGALHAQVLDAAVVVMRADMASLQTVDENRGGLRLLGSRGFEPAFAQTFAFNDPDARTACSLAWRTGRRVVVPDVEANDFMAGTSDLEDLREAGIRSVQSTPLISRTGAVVGIISTHCRQPHEPADSELRQMDILARMAADLMDRKRAVEQLRRNAETFFNLVQNSPFGVYIVDAQFRLVQVSAGSRKVFSDIDPLIGRDLAEVLHIIWPEPFANEVISRFRHTLETGEPYHAPNTTEQRQNIDEVESYDWKIERITLPDGQNGVVCHFYDATRLRQAEASLKKATQEAEAASRAKDRFLAVLSHELRTPLTPVMLAVAARELDPDLPLPLRDDLRMIRRNVELEVRLIDDLLDLSRITSGKLRLTFDVLDVNDLVRHVCEMCRSNVREKRIDLRCDLDPAASEVVGDPGRLQQVFWNLLNNATKFTPEGGHIHVTTENTDDGGGQVRVTVRDTGIGIAPDVLPRVFDAFEQGDVSVTRKFGGMGLGLAISKVLVEQHRGSIHAETGGMNNGSTFVVQLPSLAPADAPADVPAQAPPGGNGRALGPLRVLIVEDHGDTANVLRRLLSASGHDVKIANTATDALTLAGAHAFDLVLSDLGLPDMTGYELMTRIKQRHGVKGIAMSGYGMDDDIKRSVEAGFSDHIVKPLSMAQLERAIRRVAEPSV